jgi:hypothetical protein
MVILTTLLTPLILSFILKKQEGKTFWFNWFKIN